MHTKRFRNLIYILGRITEFKHLIVNYCTHTSTIVSQSLEGTFKDPFLQSEVLHTFES